MKTGERESIEQSCQSHHREPSHSSEVVILWALTMWTKLVCIAFDVTTLLIKLLNFLVGLVSLSLSNFQPQPDLGPFDDWPWSLVGSHCGSNIKKEKLPYPAVSLPCPHPLYRVKLPYLHFIVILLLSPSYPMSLTPSPYWIKLHHPPFISLHLSPLVPTKQMLNGI